MQTFKQFLAIKKIRVEVPESLVPNSAQQLEESTSAKVGRYAARRDQPHFQGDEYHAHAEVPGGYEVSWNKSGTRRHPSKFPANVPTDAKAAVAKVLGVNPDLLEAYEIFDETIEEKVILLAFVS